MKTLGDTMPVLELGDTKIDALKIDTSGELEVFQFHMLNSSEWVCIWCAQAVVDRAAHAPPTDRPIKGALLLSMGTGVVLTTFWTLCMRSHGFVLWHLQHGLAMVGTGATMLLGFGN